MLEAKGHVVERPDSPPQSAAFVRILLIAAFGFLGAWAVVWFQGRSEEPAPAPVQRAASFPLGTGSAIASPFWRADAVPGGPMGAVPSKRRNVPRAVLALGKESAGRALDRLGARARAGDAQAALDAFDIAEYCAGANAYRGVLRGMPAAADPQLRAQIETQAHDSAQACLGTTPAQLGERYANVWIAAQSGLPGAALRLLDAAMSGQPNGALSDTAAADAVALVRRDAMGGDVQALTAMANVYQNGGPVTRDAVQALSYQLAAEQLMRTQPQAYSSFDLAQQREFSAQLESQVSADERNSARKAALGLVAYCCSQ